MAAYSSASPKSPDSMDEELADITDWNSSTGEGGRSKRSGIVEDNDSNEDTEDASEDGGETRSEAVAMKEQMYFDKLGLLKAHLEELEYGKHPDFIRGLAKIEQERQERLRSIEVWREHEAYCIERDFMNEKKLAVREFEDKKNELRGQLVGEWEEKKKQIEQERYSMELSLENLEVKPVSTRKLRRRPNEPVPLPEKRRKLPQSQITFLLDEKIADDDTKAIAKACGAFPVRKLQVSPSSASHGSGSGGNVWFHRGQPVFVEGTDVTSKVSGVICAIGQDTIWIRKVMDQTKFRVMLNQLVKGTCAIKRRA